MSEEPLRSLLRGLRRLGDRPGGALTDAQLLERFVRQRDQAAFELLVWRHGPLVLGVCRRLLRHEQDIEDAFQATFLVLVRKASSIVRREAVGGWLYKVAYRVALAARATAAARAAREEPWADQHAADEADELIWRDLRPLLDEEVMRLPEKYRAPFVLCCLQGMTNEEAAAQLGCPRGTVLSRLARARERLRLRLTRRGVALSAAALATTAAERGLAAVPSGFLEMTIKAIAGGAAGVSARAAALAEGVLHVMVVSKLKVVLLVAALVGIAGVGTGFLSAGGSAGGPAAAAQSGTATAQPGAGQPARGAEKEDPAAEALLQDKSENNLKRIGLALHSYHDTYKRFPAPAIYGKDGKPLLSWRVPILAFLDGYRELFKAFRLDEPWDSPHNKKLLAKIPDLYAPVRGPSKVKGGTYYQAFVGHGAGFEPGKMLPFSDFRDGLSNTILVVEAATPVPWTKPEDLPYVQDQALPRLGGQFKGHFVALFADGDVQLLSRNADEEMLRRAITRNDGEVLDMDKLRAPQTAQVGKLDLDLLPRELPRLRAALKKALAEVQQAKEELTALKARLPQGPQAADPKVKRLLQEHAELWAALEHALQELRALRAEKARLQDILDPRRKK
jgi:RNA polymerase sigma factor (sigma-70 family)